MSENEYVDMALKLLAGMQKIRLTASDVIVNQEGVQITGLTLWDPPSIDLRVPSEAEFNGHEKLPGEQW
jgi:hypothetical protein